jgi:hypothetical protein
VSILNRRNAILGWGVWQLGKATAKRKAKQSMEPKDMSRKKKGGAVVSAIAAAGGALYFWRRRRGNDESQS